MTQQKQDATDEATNSLDERRSMYFDAEADDTRIDAALGELRLLPLLKTRSTTDDLEQRLQDIVHQEKAPDSDS